MQSGSPAERRTKGVICRDHAVLYLSPESSMPVLPPKATKVVFGPFEFDGVSGELRKHNSKIKLPAQPRQVLDELVKRPGSLVLREDLCTRLWPELRPATSNTG